VCCCNHCFSDRRCYYLLCGQGDTSNKTRVRHSTYFWNIPWEDLLTLYSKNSRVSSVQTLLAIARNIWELPAPVQRVCNVQFFAWMGWFPFLFYSTTYVADIYHDTVPQDDAEPASDRVGEEVRAGSFAFLIYSLISLATSIVLPLMVTSSYLGETTHLPPLLSKYLS
jgi:hypothetical protein